MKKIASSGSVGNLAVLINKYFYSTGYYITADLELKNDKLLQPPKFRIEFKKSKYTAYQL